MFYEQHLDHDVDHVAAAANCTMLRFLVSSCFGPTHALLQRWRSGRRRLATHTMDALQITSQHIVFHAGSSACWLSKVVSKFIDDVEGNNGWANSGPTSIRNYYNLAAKNPSSGAMNIPQSLVISYIYELPIGKGKPVGSIPDVSLSMRLSPVGKDHPFQRRARYRKVVCDQAVGHYPLSIAPANNSLGQYGGNRRPDIVGNIHVPNPTINKWFNTSAFQDLRIHSPSVTPHGILQPSAHLGTRTETSRFRTIGVSEILLDCNSGPRCATRSIGQTSTLRISIRDRVQHSARLATPFLPEIHSSGSSFSGEAKRFLSKVRWSLSTGS